MVSERTSAQPLWEALFVFLVLTALEGCLSGVPISSRAVGDDFGRQVAARAPKTTARRLE